MITPPTRERLARLLGPAGPEVSCDECFELLDQYVDLELDGADADARLPGMRAHLEGCPACREDHASLRAAVAALGVGLVLALGGCGDDGDDEPRPATPSQTQTQDTPRPSY